MTSSSKPGIHDRLTAQAPRQTGVRMRRAEIGKRLFDAEEYHLMGEIGPLGEDDRVELIGGEIVEMTSIGARHPTCVTSLNHMLVERFEGRYFVSLQNPVRVSELPLYAKTGIPETWIVDLEGKKVEVHSEPAADGYRSIRIFGAGEEVRSPILEDLSVPVDEALA